MNSNKAKFIQINSCPIYPAYVCQGAMSSCPISLAESTLQVNLDRWTFLNLKQIPGKVQANVFFTRILNIFKEVNNQKNNMNSFLRNFYNIKSLLLFYICTCFHFYILKNTCVQQNLQAPNTCSYLVICFCPYKLQVSRWFMSFLTAYYLAL